MDFPRSAFRRDFQYSTFNVHWPVARLNQPRHVRRSLSHRARLPREQTGRVFASLQETRKTRCISMRHIARIGNRDQEDQEERVSESRKRKSKFRNQIRASWPLPPIAARFGSREHADDYVRINERAEQMRYDPLAAYRLHSSSSAASRSR